MIPRIRSIAGLLQGEEFILSPSDLRIGRGRANEIRLPDPLVSLKHCAVFFDEGRCLLHDYGSDHGVFVGDFRINFKELQHGEHFRVGRTVFAVLLADEIDAAILQPTETELRLSWTIFSPERTG